MWEIGNQKVDREKDFNEEILKIQGELDEIQAKIVLAKFLRKNIGFTLYLLSGVDMLPMQEIIIRSIFKRDNGLVVGARGGSKSTLIVFMALLYPILHFNSKMCLISTNFRASRRILEQAEQIINSRKAKLLKQCFENKQKNTKNIIERAPDLYRIRLGEPSNSEVFSLPLTEGLRGTRATFVCVDELVTVSEEMVEVIIRPFLTARQNYQEEVEIRRQEDELIKLNKMTEKDRVSFPRNKFCGFSSASYQFQYLYKYYTNLVKQIMEPKDDSSSNFCMRFSYEAFPEKNFLDMTQINIAKQDGGENTDYFKREYRAIFTDSSGSYFNIKKLNDCTIKIGNHPTTCIKGNKNSEYILSIDPSYSSSKGSDFFAMGVYLINKDERKITLVHTYGRAGGEIKEHFEYLVYLLTFFNIIFVVIDDSGTEFITGFNESSIAQSRNIKLGFITTSFDTDDYQEYQKALQEAKNEYNMTNRKIVYPQKFNASNGAIRRMNETLKNNIEAERVWFASHCRSNNESFNGQKDIQLPFDFRNNKEEILDIGDFIELQDELIDETKAEAALIEVKSTVTGILQYDLPQSIRRLKSDNRPRKDLYTCLLLGNWAAKIYFDMIFVTLEETMDFMTPIIIR